MQYISKILICVIIICTIITLVNQKQVEGYRPFYYHKKYCPDCGYKNRRKCRKCINCGVCWTYDGRGECVPGDKKGPYFRSDCHAWEYGKSYNPYKHGYYYFPWYYSHRRPYYKRGSYYWNKIKKSL